MKELRPYQENIVKQVVESNKNTLICLPTGGGKTVIATEIIKRLEGPVIFIVPRLELIKQADEEFSELNPDIVWSNKTRLTGSHCIIASKDSIRTQYKKLPEDDYTIILDEVHIGLKTSHKIINQINPKRVIGLTATPERMDGMALMQGDDKIHKYGLFDEYLQEETVISLIKKGFLSPLKYYSKPIEGITDIKPTNSTDEELSDEQMNKIFDDNAIWGDLVASYEEYGKGRPALGFTKTIAMAQKVCAIFVEAGYDFRVISGDMDVEKRNELIELLRTQQIDGLVNAALLTYGFDCPPVSYAFSCRHIKSRPLWFQIVGRILRISEDKENAIFVDHGNSIAEFSEIDCSLPILDPLIKWRIDGESADEKTARKRNRKRINDSFKLLQELDPLPINLVEITPEDSWGRLIKVLKKLEKENHSLLDEKDKLLKEKESLKEEKECIKAENDKIAKNSQRLAANNIELRSEKNELIQRNRELEQRKAIKSINANKTFEYVRKNYCRIRQTFPGSPRSELAHRYTVSEIQAAEEKLDFYFDKYTLLKGLNYWKTHYKP